MNVIDTHTHLDHIENLDETMARAEKAGVSAVIAVSENLESCRKNLAIKRKGYPQKIYLGMGIHPSEADLNGLDECLNYVRENVSELTVIGEIGLDFWYKWVRKDAQKKKEQKAIFSRFLQLAREFDRPAVIHSRGAWRECLDMTLEAGVKKAEFHWYSGPIDVLNDILDQGYFVSTTPSLAYSPQSQDAIKHAPIEQTLIETDTPVFYRNRLTGEEFQAEPKDVVKTLDAYCQFKKVDRDRALGIFNNNAVRFFNLDEESLN